MNQVKIALNFIIENFSSLCKPIDPKNALDYASLASGIADMFAGIVQYHNRGDIEATCEYLQSSADAPNGNELSALGDLFKSRSSSNCVDAQYSATVAAYKNTFWNSSSATSASNYIILIHILKRLVL